jgi:hypothetical protein
MPGPGLSVLFRPDTPIVSFILLIAFNQFELFEHTREIDKVTFEIVPVNLILIHKETR